MDRDQPSFDDFVAAHARGLHGFGLALTGDVHDAWDLTQEALVRLAERWPRVRDNPTAYARTTMVRLNVDRLRRLRRELLPGTPPHDRPVLDAPSLGAEAWLVAALRELTPRQRTALALRHVEDLDVAGIAERMGCTTGTAKSHLSRGLERLRALAPADPVPSEE